MTTTAGNPHSEEEFLAQRIPNLEFILAHPAQRDGLRRFAPDIYASPTVQRKIREIEAIEKTRREFNSQMLASLTPECRREWNAHMSGEKPLSSERWGELVRHAAAIGVRSSFCTLGVDPVTRVAQATELMQEEEKHEIIIKLDRERCSVPAVKNIFIDALRLTHASLEGVAERCIALALRLRSGASVSELLANRERREMYSLCEQDYSAQRDGEGERPARNILTELTFIRFGLYIVRPWGITPDVRITERQLYEEPLMAADGETDAVVRKLLPELMKRAEDHIVRLSLERLFGWRALEGDIERR